MRTDKEFHLNGVVIAIVSNCAKPGESKVATRNKMKLTRTSQTVKELSLF